MSAKTLDAHTTQAVHYCVPLWLRDEQIRSNIAKISGRIQPVYATRTERIAVVCFGPSLRETWEQVKDFEYVISCSGSHKFLLEHGITPTWHVEVDPRDHMAAEHEARALGLTVVGVWHSHPDHPAEPSETDRASAWEGWSYLIARVTAGGVEHIRSWRLAGERFVEEPVTSS